jgi:23S rRNA-/tRNA-specific pseudouridylate synthase
VTPLHVTVLFRDARWLAVDKPAHVPTTAPDAAGVASLVDLVRAQHAGDAPRLHPLSRLDVEVTGVVLLALTDAAIELAVRERAAGRYARRYVALLAAVPEPRAGTWDLAVGVDPRDPRRRVAGGGREPRPACTLYSTLGQGAVALAALDLKTGRTHQIRVHARAAGCPVVGDRTYGGPRHVTLTDGTVLPARRTMLHSRRVRVPGTDTAIAAPAPPDLAELWVDSGGDARALDES